MGQIRPLGKDVVIFPHGSPLAVLTTAEAPWPAESSKALGMKFRGYRIDALHQPILTYDFGLLAVEDFISPAPIGERLAFHRTLNFSGAAPDGLHLRLATGKCSPESANTWRVNDVLTMKVVSADAPILRGAAGKQELIVPLRTHGDKARLEVDYAW